jgi:hypothetical protein
VPSSIELIGLKRFLSTRWVYGADHRLHQHEFDVLAVNGPEACNIINILVAEDYKKFAPAQPKPPKKEKGKKSESND